METSENRFAELRRAFVAARRFWRVARKASEALLKSEGDLDSIQTQLSACESAIANLEVDEAILAQAETVRRFQETFAGLRKSITKRSTWVAERQSSLDAIEQLLSDMGRSFSLDDIDRYQIPSDQRIRILSMANEKTKLTEQLNSVESQLRKAKIEQQRIKLKLEQAGATIDISSLGRHLNEMDLLGDPEEQLELWSLEADKLQTKCDALAKRLVGFEGSAQEANLLRVPSHETIDLFAAKLEKVEDERITIEKSQKDIAKSIKKIDKELAEIQKAYDIPTIEQLLHVRRTRDSGWEILQERFNPSTSSGRTTERLLEFAEQNIEKELVANADGATNLIEAFEWYLKKADQLADRLRDDAELVAKVAALTSQRGELESYALDMQHQLEANRVETESILNQWHAAWSDSSVTPLTPREMREWIKKLDELQSLVSQWNDKQLQIAKRQHIVDDAKRQLRKAIEVAELIVPRIEQRSDNSRHGHAKSTRRGFLQRTIERPLRMHSPKMS